MGNPELTPQERFTYRNYRTWPDDERWELIDGHAWAMSPAPIRRRPRREFLRNAKRRALKANLGTRPLAMERGRDQTMLQRAHGFDKAGHARRGVKMADVALD